MQYAGFTSGRERDWYLFRLWSAWCLADEQSPPDMGRFAAAFLDGLTLWHEGEVLTSARLRPYLPTARRVLQETEQVCHSQRVRAGGGGSLSACLTDAGAFILSKDEWASLTPQERAYF